jgi:hypothetical protein
MISIDGFSPLQKEIAERLWYLESMEQVAVYISSIPLELQWQAWAVLQMLLAAHIDQSVVTAQDCDIARILLQDIANH